MFLLLFLEADHSIKFSWSGLFYNWGHLYRGHLYWGQLSPGAFVMGGIYTGGIHQRGQMVWGAFFQGAFVTRGICNKVHSALGAIGTRGIFSGGKWVGGKCAGANGRGQTAPSRPLLLQGYEDNGVRWFLVKCSWLSKALSFYSVISAGQITLIDNFNC